MRRKDEEFTDSVRSGAVMILRGGAGVRESGGGGRWIRRSLRMECFFLSLNMRPLKVLKVVQTKCNWRSAWVFHPVVYVLI